MITYRYAFNAAGLLVDCLRLTEANRGVFKCPSCNAPLILVLPTHATAHFRHAQDAACSGETYLHRAAKQAFKQAFDYYAGRGGYFVQGQKSRLCISDVFGAVRVEEAADGGTQPDLTLVSKHPDNRRLFIEIFVTHRVSWHSALIRYYPTIEIPIHNEADIERLRADTLDLRAEGTLLYDNGLDIEGFLANPLYLTARQFRYIQRYGWARFENPDTSSPAMLCALLELGALDAQGCANTTRLAAIKDAYAKRLAQ